MIKEKNTNKLKMNKFLINGLKGFIFGATPIVILDIQTIISVGYFPEIISKIKESIVYYGFIGFIISIFYTYSSHYYPKISRYALWVIIVGYYLFILVYFLIGVSFHMSGPLLS